MKKVLVVGYARSGKYAALLLEKNGYAVSVTDAKVIDDKNELESLGIKVFDGGHPATLIAEEWEFVVKNPGIPYHAPFIQQLIEKKQRILTEIEVASWFVQNYEYAAITGTNGKTTITALLGHLLKMQYPKSYAVGNIGIPLSELVYHEGDIEAKIALEISGFQLVGIESFHPSVSVITNLTPDHLDYFTSLDEYYQSKTRVYLNQNEDDWYILNCDDEEVVKYSQNVPCKIIRLSLNKKQDIYLDHDQVYLFDTFLFSKTDLKLVGKHNLVNAMIAATMAFKMGVTAHHIQKGIQEFYGVAHRIEYVKVIDEVAYYNDSKATNVDSTIVALQSFEQPIILLAGGYDKKTGFNDLIPYMDKVKKLIVYGATKMQLQVLKNDTIVVNTLEEAILVAKKEAVAHDIILLSPACASYDQYQNFEERGEEFKRIVNEL